ncbi:Cullin-1 -like protein [Gossypium arboreum]|uniref:Cullin-1-like protein n=1 Tax=Gossypium arboreum TaxID=29729 RepID=A0A0B0PT35_GOSAR|nr:Cullin-1 -like protein [Gossypium arboreum]
MILKYIPLDEGMMIMDEAIVKAKKIIEGYPETKFSGEEYQRCVYFMCTYHSSNEKTMQLYEKFRNSLEESIFSTVLPTLVNKQGANLLREFVVIWSNYKLMARWLCRFFEYLDRFFIPQHIELESLNGISFSCFRDLVFKKLYCRLIEAALTLINQEREGQQIDCVLLKNVLDIFVEISDYKGANYYEDFERIMLTEISGYYSRLASEWLLYDSSAEYVQKVFWCLNREKQRARQYLHPDTEIKIVQVVRYHLLDQIANKLMEKRQAENSGMVTDYQWYCNACECTYLLQVLLVVFGEAILLDHLVGLELEVSGSWSIIIRRNIVEMCWHVPSRGKFFNITRRMALDANGKFSTYMLNLF